MGIAFKKNKKKIQILMISLIIIMIMTSIAFIRNSKAYPSPNSTIRFSSQKLDYGNKEYGSFEVEKNVEWISTQTAKLKFQIHPISESLSKLTDIIYVMNLSSHSDPEKFQQLKTESINFTNTLLSNTENQMALITFSKNSEIVSGFTNQKEMIINEITKAEMSEEENNYYQALLSIDQILKDYQKKDDRNCMVLFLTNGFPKKDVSNQNAQYQYLKNQYPDVIFQGIQYEMGEEIIDSLKEVSDTQIATTQDTIGDILTATISPSLIYHQFVLTDFIDSRYFDVEDSSIQSSIGNSSLESENGNSKIVWSINQEPVRISPTLTVNLTLKEDYQELEGVYGTSISTNVLYCLNHIEESVETNNTPTLATHYHLIYDYNVPEGCNIDSFPKEASKKVFDLISVYDNTPSCGNYHFEGWKVVSNEVEWVNEKYFMMPKDDVTLRAEWSKVSLVMRTEGTVYNAIGLYETMKDLSTSDDISSEFVTSEQGIDFSLPPGNTNGKGIYKLSNTEEDTNPIYYYRGAVNDNHVIFANICWKIVRTTETKGVKLIYNGVPNQNNQCISSTTATQISNSNKNTFVWNQDTNALNTLGYYPNSNYPVKIETNLLSQPIVYGSDILYQDNQYELQNPITSTDWNLDRVELGKTHHYTCFSNSTHCSSVNYIYNTGENDQIPYLTLENGQTIENVVETLKTNGTKSNIATIVESWAEENLKEYKEDLEDTVWCNDRGVFDASGWKKDGNANQNLLFAASGRLDISNTTTIVPNLTCSNSTDQFAVERGNGLLTYPVALLTADEATLAGSGVTGFDTASYLNSGQSWWTMTPKEFRLSSGAMYVVDENGQLNDGLLNESYGIRPVISLKTGISILDGDGTPKNPYILGRIQMEKGSMNATVIQVNNNRLTVQDKNHGIYTFAVNNIEVENGSSIHIEYLGTIDKNRDFQNVKVLNYNIIEPSLNADGIKESWLDDGIFSDYYKQAKKKLDTLTLDQKIAQILLVSYPVGDPVAILKKYQFGGYLFFANNFENKTESQVQEMINNAQNIANIPLLTAVDEEGGSVVRVSKFPNLAPEPHKSSRELYAMGGLDLIRQDTINKSKLLNNLGLNLNLAPVVDVSTNPTDYMYKRSLGEGPEITSDFAKTVIEASHGNKVSYTLKHFPGYGNNSDTHLGTSVDKRTYEDLLKNDLPPFKAGIDAKAEAVLISHNIVSSIDATNPSTLSPSIHNELRNHLGFTGIIITDDMSMGAVSKIDNAVVKAILAGNDFIITGKYEKSFNEIKTAVENGTISEDMISYHAFRIIAWKYYKGLLTE